MSFTGDQIREEVLKVAEQIKPTLEAMGMIYSPGSWYNEFYHPCGVTVKLRPFKERGSFLRYAEIRAQINYGFGNKRPMVKLDKLDRVREAIEWKLASDAAREKGEKEKVDGLAKLKDRVQAAFPGRRVEINDNYYGGGQLRIAIYGNLSDALPCLEFKSVMSGDIYEVIIPFPKKSLEELADDLKVRFV